MPTRGDSHKVLFIVPHLSNSMRLLADYLRYLDRSFEVTLFSLGDDLTLDHEFPPQARRIILRPTNKLIQLPRMLWKLFRAAKDQDLLVSWVELTPTYLASVIARLRGKPLLGWVHTHVGRIMELNLRPRKLHEPFIRRFYPALAATVGCSQGVADDMRDRYGLTNTIAVPNGIDIPRIRALASEPVPAPFRHIFEKPTIAFVATLHPLKNPHLLIRMHAALIQQGIDHHLLVAGIGHLRDELQQLARELDVGDTVFFVGFVQNPYPLIRASTVFVLTSVLEGFALVLAEALALGVPVVSTDCPAGPREVLDGGKYGLLVPEGQLDPLVNAVRSVLTDAQQRERMRQTGLPGAERHSIEPRTRQMEDLFRRAIAEHGAVTSLSHLAAHQPSPRRADIERV